MKVKLLPYERFEIITELPPEEVERRFKEAHSRGGLFDNFLIEKVIEGNVKYLSFEMSHTLLLNRGNPVIHGKISNENNGSRITIIIKPRIWHIGWGIIFYGMLLSTLISMSKKIVVAHNGIYIPDDFAITLTMMIFIWLLVIIGFRYKVWEYRKIISRTIKQ